MLNRGAVFLSFSAVVWATPAAARSPAGTSVVQLLAAHSGKCLTVAGHSQERGARVLQLACREGDTSQHWRIEPRTRSQGQQRLVAVHSGMCLDVEGERRDDGTPLIQWPCKPSGSNANQLWTLKSTRGGAQLVAAHSNGCADVAAQSRVDGAPLIQYRCIQPVQSNQTFATRAVSGQHRVERPEVPPARPPAERDCGTGDDDPGCDTPHRGSYPLDATAFGAALTALRAESSDYNRLDVAKNLLSNRVLTARQLGAVLELFRSDQNRLDTARALIPAVVDRANAAAHAAQFRSSYNRKQYAQLLAKR